MHACGMRFLTTYKCLCGEHIRQSCVQIFSDFTNAFTCFHFTVVSSCVFQVVNKNGGRWLPNFTWPGWKQTGNTYSIEYHRTKSPAFGSFWGGVSSLFLLRYLPTSFGMSNASVARVNRYTVCIFLQSYMISSIDFSISVWIFWWFHELLQGQNPRYTHTYIDEDNMRWLKRTLHAQIEMSPWSEWCGVTCFWHADCIVILV